MRRFKPPYAPEFRARIVELARAGRSLASLAKEFGVTDMSIRNWLRQADLDAGRRTDGLTTEEKQELARLRKENARLREERVQPSALDPLLETDPLRPGNPRSTSFSAPPLVSTTSRFSSFPVPLSTTKVQLSPCTSSPM